MKAKGDLTSDSKTEGLTFAWERGDEVLIRFWISLFLVSVLFVAAWKWLRVVVPVEVSPDRPLIEKAQLILIDSESHPSLTELLEDRNLPSLGAEESMSDVPFVGEMLALLGVEEEKSSSIQLYPAPELVRELAWPSEEGRGPTFFPLDEVQEKVWPSVAGPGKDWTLEVSAQGQLGELLDGKRFPWRLGEPAERESLWSVAFDSDGALVFASSIASLEAETEGEIRRLFEAFFAGHGPYLEAASGLMQVSIRENKE